MKLRLTSRLILTFALLVALLLTTVGMLSYRSGSEGLKAAAVSDMLGNAIEKEAELDLWIEERLDDVRLFASHVDVVEKSDKLVAAASGSEAARVAHALILQELEPVVTAPGSAYIELFVMEPGKGKVLASTSPAEEGKLKVGQPYFDNGRTDLYLQEPYRSAKMRDAVITIEVPLRTSDGRVVAVLAARLNLAVLNAIILRRTGLHQTMDAFLVNAEQYPVTQPRFIKEPVVLRRKLDSAAVRLLAARNSGVILAPDYRGVPSIAVYRWNSKHNLGMIVKIDQSEALAPVRAYGRTVALISVLALFITTGLAFLLARSITRPLLSLHESVSRFSEGKIAEPLPESSGDEIGLLARSFNQMVKCVTERTSELAKANEALQMESAEHIASEAARDRLIAILENTTDMVGIAAPDGQILYCNKAGRALVGVGLDADITKYAIMEFLPNPTSNPCLTEGIPAAISTGTWSGEASLVSRSGREIHISQVILAHKACDGQLEYLSTIMRDITERKQMEKKLEAALEASVQAGRAKSLFLSNMSHELRTPLNAILGFSRLMRDSASITAEQHETLDIINRSGEHLLNLINDVLDMAKIEAGHVSFKNAPFDLGGMLRDVIDLMAGRAAEKDLELRLNQSSEFPRFVRSDGNKLRQMLLNLVGNAIKFTQQGHVELRLSTLTGDSAQYLRLIIEVEDTGSGIAAEDLPHVFEPFIQVGNQALQKGTGLGLAIAHQQVELMGGLISAESTPGTGSLFRVEVPVDRVDACEVAAVKTDPGRVVGLVPSQPECRILIVEDQMENWMLMQMLLEGVGFLVQVAQDGAAGIVKFQAWRTHCVLMDIRMPVMDGLEATRGIRSLEGGRDVKIVVVTASVFEDDLVNIMKEEIDDYILKPYRPEEIYACLAKHLGVRFVTEEPQTPVATGPSDVLDHEALAALPLSLCKELTDAVVSLDAGRIDALIRRVSELDPVMGNALAKHAERLSYSKILQAMKDGSRHSEKVEAT